MKKTYDEFVTLTDEEHQKLTDRYGQNATERLIETLANYKGAHGKEYKSDYRAILSWVVGEVLGEIHKEQTVVQNIRDWARK